MGLNRLAHVELKTNDIQEALAFHVDVLGLTELERDGDTVYFGCGVDENYDVAISPGGTGLAHYAFDVGSEEDLQHSAQRLSDAGVKVEWRTDGEPGQAKAVRFATPSGHVMELVLLRSRENYLHPALPKLGRHGGIAPLDADHLTLMVADVKTEVTFLRDVLGLHVSDVFEPQPGVWGGAWTRAGEYHHDLAMLQRTSADETLHHFAWTMESLDHMKRAADALAQHGILLEAGLGRHGIGSNLFAYFQAPGGNRYELSSEMGRLSDPTIPPTMWSNLEPQGMSAWGQMPYHPESFWLGS